MSTTIITEPSAVLSARACAYLGPLLERAADEIRRDRIDVPPEVDEAVAKMSLLGDAFVIAHQPGLSSVKAPIDRPTFDAVVWTTAADAADSLKVTPQAVTALLRRKSAPLHGEQHDRIWRVCAEDVAARMKGTRCPHV